MNDPVIQANCLDKAFGDRPLWSDLSFTVVRGEMLALTGVSGSGKSTLLNCLGVLDRVDSGTITVAGTVITALGRSGRRRYRRDTLGYLFQDYALIENSTITDNLAVALPAGLRRPERSRRMSAALELVGLQGRHRAIIHELSGGEQQRVALARLIVKQPTVVLADEPTGALDEANADMVVSTLADFCQEGASVVIATHNHSVESRCDRTLRLSGPAEPGGAGEGNAAGSGGRRSESAGGR